MACQLMNEDCQTGFPKGQENAAAAGRMERWQTRMRRGTVMLLLACGSVLVEGIEDIEPLFLDSIQGSRPMRVAGGSHLAALNPKALQTLGPEAIERLYRLDFLATGRFLRITTHKALSDDVHSFSAGIEGEPASQVLLVRKGRLLAGSVVFQDGRAFQINPVDDFLCEWHEVNAYVPPLCGVGESADSFNPLLTQPRSTVRTRSTTETAMIPGEFKVEAPEREVEFMIVFSPLAKSRALVPETFELALYAAVAEADQAFRNSGTGVQLRLVHMAEIDYEESGDVRLDLKRLQSPNDGYMDEVHAWRDAHQADLVCLVVDQAERYVGMALYPTGPEGGFSVLDRFHLIGLGMLAHELGHNFGCDHDRDNASGGGQFGFSFGHRFDVDGQVHRTLMCYAPGWPVRFFSNPRLAWQGIPLGISEGEPGQADNARTIREMAVFVDLYRGVTARMSSPPDGSLVTEGEPIPLAISVHSTEGAVEGVAFFANGTLLGELNDLSSVFLWTNAPAGKHVLWAQITLAGFPKTTERITVSVKPQNDDFANRQHLEGTNLKAVSVLSTASAEPGEPAHFETRSHSVWWTWTAPISGMVRVAASGPAWVRPKAAVYRGTALSELQLVARAGYPWGDAFFSVAAGELYQMVLDGDAAEVPVFLYLTMHQPPANDHFADAQPVESGKIQGSTLAATREPGEPVIGNAAFGHSIWFRWTPPQSGRADLAFDRTVTDPLTDLAVFTGEDLASLALVASSSQARHGFQVTARVPYWIVVDGPYGNVLLNAGLISRPANDNFAGRAVLNGFPGNLLVNNFAATQQPGEPVHGRIPGGKSQWWSWRPPSNGAIRFSRPEPLQRSSSPLALAIYTGSALSNLVLQRSHGFVTSFQSGASPVVDGAALIDPDGVPQESFVVPVLAGTNYFIAIDGRPATNTPQSVHLMWIERSGNDHFRQRQLRTSIPAVVSGSTFWATPEPGEPPHGGRPARHSVWWSWTFRTNGLVAATVDCTGPNLPFLSVYRGTSLSNLVLVADNRAGRLAGATVVFSVEAGERYQIAIDEETSSFTYSLQLRSTAAPANDDFAARTRLLSIVQEFPGSTIGASVEPGEPQGVANSGGSVWYTWNGRAAELTSVLAVGSREIQLGSSSPKAEAVLPPPEIAVYTGSSLGELRRVASGLGLASFHAERNVPYQISAAGVGGSSGAFSLSIVEVARNDSFLGAIPLPETQAAIRSSLLALRCATSEPGEPAHGRWSSGHSLWWSWTPRQSGSYVLEDLSAGDRFSSPVAITKAIYTGAALSELMVVASNRWGSLPFIASGGTKYFIALDFEDSLTPPNLSRTQVSMNLSHRAAFLSPALRPGRTVEFTVVGAPGRTVLLQSSSDLIDWHPVQTTVLPSANFRFSEPRPLLVPQKFYRAVPWP